METQLSEWGNNLALRIPKPVAEAAKVRVGDTLDLYVEGPGAVRMRRPAPKPTLEGLVANQNAGLLIACPISRVKGYPFEVPMPSGSRIQGVILADHLKSLDWRRRQAEKAGKISGAVLE